MTALPCVLMQEESSLSRQASESGGAESEPSTLTQEDASTSAGQEASEEPRAEQVGVILPPWGYTGLGLLERIPKVEYNSISKKINTIQMLKLLFECWLTLANIPLLTLACPHVKKKGFCHVTSDTLAGVRNTRHCEVLTSRST